MAPFLSNDERNMATRDAREFLRGAIPPTVGGGEPQPQPGKRGMMPQGPDRNVMTLEAIHPASLEKLFQFFERFNQPQRNWPIPRQYGGPLEEGKEYITGEGGNPEKITMYPGGGGEAMPVEYGAATYDPGFPSTNVTNMRLNPTSGVYEAPRPGGLAQESIWKHRAGQRPPTPAQEFLTGAAGDIVETGKRAWGGIRNVGAGLLQPFLPAGTQIPDYTYNPPTTGGTIPEGGRVAPLTGPRPWQDINRELLLSHAPSTGFPTPTPGRNWEDMGQGIFGGFPTAGQGRSVADEMAVERYNKEVTDAQRRQAAYDSYLADRELGQAAGVIPRTGMAEYEYNSARMRMGPKERLLEAKATGEARKQYFANRGAADVANLEHGWESPASQERLARAYNLREMPGVERERTTEYAQSRIDVARENAIQRRETAKSQAEAKKVDRELNLYNRTLNRYPKTDIEGNKTVDIEAAAPEIKRLIKAGLLNEDFGIDLPQKPPLRYRVEGKGTIDLTPEEEKVFLKKYPKAQKVS